MDKAVNTGFFEKWRTRRLRQRAAGDLAQLFSAELTSADAERIKAWRGQPQDYQEEFLATSHTLADVDGLAEDPDILALIEDADRQARRRTPAALQPRRWPALAAAAAIIVAVGAGLFRVMETGEPVSLLRYVTRIGEQKTVELADGSQVTLNTGTELLVTFTDESRRVLLERGEAYFVVAADPQRPFTVNLDQHAVSVLGTEFDIFKTPEKFTLAVLKGAVSLHEKEDTASVSAPLLAAPEGRRVVLNARGQHRIEAGTVTEFSVQSNEIIAYRADAKGMDRFNSWRTGLVRFDEEPLYLVVQELNRYIGKKILIEDSAIMDLNIYATVRLDQIDQTLVGLESSLPIKVVRHFDKIVLTQKE